MSTQLHIAYHPEWEPYGATALNADIGPTMHRGWSKLHAYSRARRELQKATKAHEHGGDVAAVGTGATENIGEPA